jgi:hypothetical protein
MIKSYFTRDSFGFISASLVNMAVLPSLDSIDDWLCKGVGDFPLPFVSSASLGNPSEGGPSSCFFDGWSSELDAAGLFLVKRNSNQCRSNHALNHCNNREKTLTARAFI